MSRLFTTGFEEYQEADLATLGKTKKGKKPTGKKTTAVPPEASCSGTFSPGIFREATPLEKEIMAAEKRGKDNLRYNIGSNIEDERGLLQAAAKRGWMSEEDRKKFDTYLSHLEKMWELNGTSDSAD